MGNVLEALLREARARERAQAWYYRALTGQADERGDTVAERLNELLADEQHHVSRITARLFELGGEAGSDAFERPDPPSLDGWEEEARRREADEVAWYASRLGALDDEDTHVIFAEILASERHHLEELGGKWMPALPPSDPGEPS